jgi:creatinine amidohydrolase
MNQMARRTSWNLAEATLHHVREKGPAHVAVLPTGATEPHNLHLPYATDTFQVQALAEMACERATQKGASVWLLPPIPFGTETNLMDYPMTINLNPSTIGAIIGDVIQSLDRHGVKKLVVLNGHGGNDLKWILREWYGKTSVNMFICHWFRMIGDVRKEILENLDGDHADELETSMMLHLRPDLVEMARADDGSMRPAAIEALRKGWVEYSRPWQVLTTNSGAGNPHKATAAKGAGLAEAFAERFANFITELSSTPVDANFPMES